MYNEKPSCFIYFYGKQGSFAKIKATSIDCLPIQSNNTSGSALANTIMIAKELKINLSYVHSGYCETNVAVGLVKATDLMD